MRREKLRIELPTVKKALHELLIPSIPLKLVRGSETGRPDDLFLIPHGRPLFIEFKWGELQPEPKQAYWHGILRNLGYDVQVHNNVEDALAAIAVEVVAAALYAARSEISARAWGRNLDVRSGPSEDEHYTRSFQFLKEAGRFQPNARDSTVKSVLSSVARRDC